MTEMPPLYTCELCGQPIDPKGGATVRLATVWVKGQSKTLFSVEQEQWRYRHEFCFTNTERNQQESLF
jgi:hypothetical protein